VTVIEQAEAIAAAAERQERARESWGYTYPPAPVQATQDRYVWLKAAGGALIVALLFGGMVALATTLMPRN
jgi:hypothetical protein